MDEGVTIKFYRDADSDSYGNPDNTINACQLPAGYVTDNQDCNDSSTSIHPGAAEICDGVDNNCNGTVDEGCTSTFYRDADNDGYGNPGLATSTTVKPSGYVANNNDCNDSNSAIHPNAAEACNGIDDDCDGVIDEGCSNTFYRDADGDGYGNQSKATTTATQPSGYVSNDDDCNDSNSAIHPGAAEICDGIDNNCNGTIDEGCANTFYRDADGDGYGNPGKATTTASRPAGYVANNSDCNDSNSSVHPGAAEVCDGVDNNCNGQVDEGLNCSGNTGQTGCSLCQCLLNCLANSLGSPCSKAQEQDHDRVQSQYQDRDRDQDQARDWSSDENGNRDKGNNDGSHLSDYYAAQNRNSGWNDNWDESDFKNHGQYVSSLAHFTNELKKEDKATGKDKGELMKKVAKDKNNGKNDD